MNIEERPANFPDLLPPTKQTITIEITYDPQANYEHTVPDIEVNGQSREHDDFPSGPYVRWTILKLQGNQTLALVQMEG